MHEHPLRRCLVESQTEKLNSTHSWTYITRIYNWAQSHFKQRHVQHRSSWWVGVWQSQLWKIASEWSHTAYLQKLHAHTNTHSFFTGLYCICIYDCPQLQMLPFHTASLPPSIIVFPLLLSHFTLCHSLPVLPLSMFPCFKPFSSCDLFSYSFFTPMRFLESSFLC